MNLDRCLEHCFDLVGVLVKCIALRKGLGFGYRLAMLLNGLWNLMAIIGVDIWDGF